MKNSNKLIDRAKQPRYLTICSKGRTWIEGRRAKLLPVIYLSGGCMKDAGFKLGEVIEIVCAPGEIIVKKAKEQGYNATKRLFATGEALVI